MLVKHGDRTVKTWCILVSQFSSHPHIVAPMSKYSVAGFTR